MTVAQNAMGTLNDGEEYGHGNGRQAGIIRNRLGLGCRLNTPDLSLIHISEPTRPY